MNLEAESISLFLLHTRELWITTHLFAMVLGLGGATYTDILLLKFLKDLEIDKKEKEVIHAMSQVVTAGVFLALISGILLFFPSRERLLESDKFLAKVSVFLVLMINGFLLHRIVLPKLIYFSFKSDHYLVSETIHLRHIGFILGAISAVSWYFIFILGSLKSLPFNYIQLISCYLITLTIAICTALFLEKTIKRKHQK